MKTSPIAAILILAPAIAQLSLLAGCGQSLTERPKGNENKTSPTVVKAPDPPVRRPEPPAPPVEQKKGEKPLDNSVEIISVARCWDYKPKAISVEGRFFENYAVLTYTCDSGEYITFDIRGWSRFKGYAAIVESDSRSNSLTIKVDEDAVAEHQLNYGASAIELDIDLRGRKTLTFRKAGRYPEMVIGEPKLFGES
jgi:hypothetical protein